MKKINTSPVSGAQEFTPDIQSVFNRYRNEIEHVFHSHGFLPVETPIIERTEILLAKAGGDTEKQIYKLVKTSETSNDPDQALRFDHTVPLARYVVEHQQSLAFPFRAAQVGINFRGEHAQRGRFREFYQCDIDVIGRNTLPIAYDAEVIATFYDALKCFDLPRMVIRISNRKLFSGFLEGIGIDESSEATDGRSLVSAVAGIIDHAEKVSLEKTLADLKELGISDDNVVKITTFMNIHGTRSEVEPQLRALNVNNEKFATGLDELLTVLRLLEQQGLGEVAQADLLIIRGLDYYTGTVFETFLPDYRKIGSIGSGGRYENLANNYTDESFPGVGGSIGLNRLFFVLRENNLLNLATSQPVDYAIIPISQNEYPACFELANKLRAHAKIVDLVLTDKRLGDKMTYAAKVAKFGIVVGEDEAKTGQYKVKDFATGEQTPLVLPE